MKTYDAIIIGAGHNGLVAAAYLARAKWKVLVLERRHVVGGACVTEEDIFPGFKVSTAAYVNSLFRPEIIAELELHKHGFELLERRPASFTPFEDGRYLMLGADPEDDVREISKFSKRDAENYPRYERWLERIADLIEPTLDQIPPNIVRPSLKDLSAIGKLAWQARKLGADIAGAIEVLTGSANAILDRWFESEELKTTLATDAIIGAFAAPSMPGTAYVLFHHVMGETNGRRGVWAYVRGGMGGLTRALARAATEYGAVIRTSAEVRAIRVADNAVRGVTLESGEEIEAKKIASNADCNVTFNQMLGGETFPAAFREAIDRIDYSSASVKINVALSALPNFSAYPGAQAGPQHHGTIHICPSREYIERAYDEAKYGAYSPEPVLECTIPSSVDDTVAPRGQHIMSMFVQYAPYKLKDGPWDDARRDAFAGRCFEMLERYAPGFTQSVIAKQVLTPADLERKFNLTGGNIFQGAMTLDRLYALRPAAGYAGYRMPLRGLYLCGSAAHPGGGVMGAAGRNCARLMLKS